MLFCVSYCNKDDEKSELTGRYKNMLEVVFSESEKGGILQAKASHGDSKEIVNIGFFLEMGEITGEIDGKERQDVYNQTLGRHDSDNKNKDYIFDEQRKDMETLLTAAHAGETIRIWKSNAPYSICGFYYVCNLLKDIDCPINTIILPKYVHSNDQTLITYNNWGEIEPAKIYDFLPLEKSISVLEKRIASGCWEALKKENAPLRAIVNGKLISVPENFYDFIIIQNLPNTEFRLGELIAKLMMEYDLNVTDNWYASRIDKLIEEDKLIIIENNANIYGRILKKTDKLNTI